MQSGIGPRINRGQQNRIETLEMDPFITENVTCNRRSTIDY